MGSIWKDKRTLWHITHMSSIDLCCFFNRECSSKLAMKSDSGLDIFRIIEEYRKNSDAGLIRDYFSGIATRITAAKERKELLKIKAELAKTKVQVSKKILEDVEKSKKRLLKDVEKKIKKKSMSG